MSVSSARLNLGMDSKSQAKAVCSVFRISFSSPKDLWPFAYSSIRYWPLAIAHELRGNPCFMDSG